jgi:hypothetical protein
VLHLKLKHDPQNETDLDLGATGPSIGDRFIFSADIFRGDDRVGVAGGDCVSVRFRGRQRSPRRSSTCALPPCRCGRARSRHRG